MSTVYEKEVSIIIPTYNRCELLEFTLLSLFEQTVSSDMFEVIVVDDHSKDDTLRVLNNLQPPFELIVLHNNINHGAAYSRNRGIKSARGRILIFLDEMLVGRNFIESHINYHRKDNMVISTHFNGQRIFSHYYRSFSNKQQRIFKKRALRLRTARQSTTKKGVLRLFSKEAVKSHEVLKYGLIAKKLPKEYESLQCSYGQYLQNMSAPWYTFVTNGVSLPRTLLSSAGYFDENLKGAWMEDWELGYRLYLAGATFYNPKDIACFHQIHPIGTGTKHKLINYLYFSKKHPVAEVKLAPAMSTIFNWSVGRLARIVTQFRSIEKDHHKSYCEFLLAFKALTDCLILHIQKIVSGQALPLLVSPQEGFARWESAFSKKVINQLERLYTEPSFSGNYLELIQGFRDLLRIPIYLL